MIANKVAAKLASEHASRAIVSSRAPQVPQPSSSPTGEGRTDQDKIQEDVSDPVVEAGVSVHFVVPLHLRSPTWGMTLFQKAEFVSLFSYSTRCLSCIPLLTFLPIFIHNPL